MSSLIHRLKERKLVQWVLSYLAGAFGALQLMSALESALGISARAQQSVVILLATGLVVTAILAWTHGEKGHQRPTTREILALALTVTVGLTASTVHWLGDDDVGSDGASILIAARDSAATQPEDAPESLALSVLLATPEEPPTSPLPVRTSTPSASPTLSPTSPAVFVSDSLRMTLDTDEPAQWTSSDRSVAMVMSDGLVLAVAPGTAEITASVGGTEVSTEITVRGATAELVDLVPIGSMRVGESAALDVLVRLSDGQVRDDVQLVWTSSDSGVARVSADGTVTALGEGSTRISARTDGVVGSILVMVEDAEEPEATAPPPSDDELFAVLERYRVALESRSVPGVMAVYPTLSAEGRARWEAVFGLGELRVGFSEIVTRQVEARAAQVEFEQILSGDRIEENATRFVADLVPSDEGWVIRELRSLNPDG